MILLGFYLGHDSNIAISVNGKIRYRKSERFFGVKHHRATVQFLHRTLKEWGINQVDYCAYTNADYEPTRNHPNAQCPETSLYCDGELQKYGVLSVPNLRVDHHYAHILSLWPQMDTESIDYGIAVDGRGDWERSMMIVKDPARNPELIDLEKGFSMGWEFNALGMLYKFPGLEYDQAGKLMGLQAYPESDYHKFGLKPLRDTHYRETLRFADQFNSVAEWHEFWWKYLRGLFRFPKESCIAYSGGCAQNTVYNYRLQQEFPNLHIPPHCYDGGLSLGCLEFLRLQHGGEPFDTTGFPYWQDDPVGEASPETVKETAHCLAKGMIVGWMQGRGEIGPRALGNRSILMAPDKAENKDILNNLVKHREAWRPYAGSVMEEYADEYFDMTNSPHMLYACKVLNDKIPAITHIDGTCRMQTVKKGCVFYDLLNEYYKLTGLPILLNTSMNIAGKPIVSAPKDASFMHRNTGMDILVVGDTIHRKAKIL